jgi:hypothetical protein
MSLIVLVEYNQQFNKARFREDVKPLKYNSPLSLKKKKKVRITAEITFFAGSKNKS